MGLLVTALFLLLVIGAMAWAYPSLKSHIGAWRRTRQYRAFAAQRGVALDESASFITSLSFHPTLMSIFGPFGRARNAIRLSHGEATVYLFEYFFGGKEAAWSYRRGASLLAMRARSAPPRFVLCEARKEPKTSDTSDTVEGSRLVVRRVGTSHELWTTERDLKNASKRCGSRLTRLLKDEPGWNLRSAGDWLLLFNRRTLSPSRDQLDDFVSDGLRILDAANQ